MYIFLTVSSPLLTDCDVLIKNYRVVEYAIEMNQKASSLAMMALYFV